jgi:hypothetical protein
MLLKLTGEVGCADTDWIELAQWKVIDQGDEALAPRH